MMVMSRGVKVAVLHYKGLGLIRCYVNALPQIYIHYYVRSLLIFHKAGTTVNIHIWHMRMNCSCCTHTDSIDNRGLLS